MSTGQVMYWDIAEHRVKTRKAAAAKLAEKTVNICLDLCAKTKSVESVPVMVTSVSHYQSKSNIREYAREKPLQCSRAAKTPNKREGMVMIARMKKVKV